MPVASNDLLRAKGVIKFVSDRAPFRFTSHLHQKAWKFFHVRPSPGAPDPTVTDDHYCRWDRLLGGYWYTSAWGDKLTNDLSDPDTYRKITDYKATPV